MKRHDIMDLFHGHLNEEMEGPWNDVKMGMPECKSGGCKIKVKLLNGNEVFAYFYEDKAQWIQKYGERPSHFWKCDTKEPLFHVTHWKYMKEE